MSTLSDFIMAICAPLGWQKPAGSGDRAKKKFQKGACGEIFFLTLRISVGTRICTLSIPTTLQFLLNFSYRSRGPNTFYSKIAQLSLKRAKQKKQSFVKKPTIPKGCCTHENAKNGKTRKSIKDGNCKVTRTQKS